MRRPLAIIVAVLVSLPSLMDLAKGHTDPATAGLRFVLALGVVWVAFAGLDHLLAAYSYAHPEDQDPDHSPA
jgi:hypothetical protein